jgi:acetyltransferase-like isoleucine patch superfamily enzyme
VLPPAEVKLPRPKWLRALSWTRWGRQAIEWGYGAVPPSLLLVNFIFQRIFRQSISAPFSVNYRSTVNHGQHIRIGRRVGASFALSGGLYVNAMRGVEIGDGTVIAPNVGILTTNHDLYDRDLPSADGPVHIGKNGWIGMNAVILPGVTLGDNVTVAAGAVVTTSFGSNVVIGGTPARVLRELTPEAVLAYRQRHGIRQIEDLQPYLKAREEGVR